MHEVFSTAMNTVAVGEGVIVCVDKKTGKPVEVSQNVRTATERLDGRAQGGA